MKNEQVRFCEDCEITSGVPIKLTQGEISDHFLETHYVRRFGQRPRRIFKKQKLRTVRRPHGRHDIGKTVATIHLA